MKKPKGILIFWFILFALPIPLSLLSWIATLTATAALGMAEGSGTFAMLKAVATLIFFLFAGMYPITYFFSLAFTIVTKKENFWRWARLPLWHIILFFIAYNIAMAQ